MRLASALVLIASTVAANAHDAVPMLPDPSKTPGPANLALDEAEICDSAFSTRSHRAGSKAARRCVLGRYGKPAFAFTYDHLAPLELGGADDNLWPEPRAEARIKDRLEDALQAHVCACHDVSLSVAQEACRRDWRVAYQVFVTPKGAPMCAVNGAAVARCSRPVSAASERHNAALAQRMYSGDGSAECDAELPEMTPLQPGHRARFFFGRRLPDWSEAERRMRAYGRAIRLPHGAAEPGVYFSPPEGAFSKHLS